MTPKKLYAVHDLRDSDFDPDNPAGDSESSPAGLNASNANMEAMRNQYIALYHYSSRLRDRLQEWEKSRNDKQIEIDAQERKVARMTAVIATEQRNKAQLLKSLTDLVEKHDMMKEEKAWYERKVKELEEEVRQWDCWKKRQTEITHYLRLLAPLARTHVAMRERLWELGLDVPDPEDALQLFGEAVRPSGSYRFIREGSHNNIGVGLLNNGSGTGAGQSFPPRRAIAAQNELLIAGPAFDDFKRAQSKPDEPDKLQCMLGMKRQRPESSDISMSDTTSRGGIRTRRLLESRDLMPPPPLPRRQTSEQTRSTLTSNATTPHRRGNRSQQQAAPASHPARRPSDEELGGRPMGRDRTHDVGMRYASPPPLATFQDGELDDEWRRRHRPTPPRRPAAPTQRLTLPPPPVVYGPPLNRSAAAAAATPTSRQRLGAEATSAFFTAVRRDAAAALRTGAQALGRSSSTLVPGFLRDPRLPAAAAARDDSGDEGGRVVSRSGRRGVRR